MAVVDIKKTAGEMIRNGTWRFENGIFYQAFRNGVAGYNGKDFFFPDSWSRRERKKGKEKLSFILGLDTDLDSFYAEISDSPFAFLAEEFRGLTVPAAPSPYQALVEVIAQQQVSFDFAQRTIANLVRLAGKPVGDIYAFPAPEEIAKLDEGKLREAKLGYRAAYIKGLTALYLGGKLNLDLWDWSVGEAIKYLMRFHGIGKWTAELFLTYGLRKNVYPAGDLGLRRGMGKIFGKNAKEIKEKDVREIIEPYGKWKGLLAFYVTCYDRKTELEMKRR